MEVGWPGGAEAFRVAVDAYADFHWKHMRKEEQELLPLAERALTREDWAEINAGFAGNHDPIADLREQDFARLFSRIVSLAPAPVGVGASWKKASA
jgi:hemerythrin-like domain-containing protein